MDRCKHGMIEGQCSLCAGMETRATDQSSKGPAWLVTEKYGAGRRYAAMCHGSDDEDGKYGNQG